MLQDIPFIEGSGKVNWLAENLGDVNPQIKGIASVDHCEFKYMSLENKMLYLPMNLCLVCIQIFEGYVYGEYLAQEIVSNNRTRFTVTELVLLDRFLSTRRHDNAIPHTRRLTRNFLDENNMGSYDWPPQSPDLNFIKHA